jgi:hypothetical protein
MAEGNGRIDGWWKIFHPDDSTMTREELRSPNPWLCRVAQGNSPETWALDIAFAFINAIETPTHADVLAAKRYDGQCQLILIVALHAPIHKIDPQRLLANLALRLRHATLFPMPPPQARKSPAGRWRDMPTVQNVRLDSTSASHFGDGSPVSKCCKATS